MWDAPWSEGLYVETSEKIGTDNEVTPAQATLHASSDNIITMVTRRPSSSKLRRNMLCAFEIEDFLEDYEDEDEDDQKATPTSATTQLSIPTTRRRQYGRRKGFYEIAEVVDVVGKRRRHNSKSHDEIMNFTLSSLQTYLRTSSPTSEVFHDNVATLMEHLSAR